MCGIAGFVDFSGRPDTGWQTSLAQMEGALAHRGPDGWGRTLLAGETITDTAASGTRTFTRQPSVRTRPSVGLVHRRLAIIDLSEGGHQPMAAPDRSSWIVYNGELYNYRALRDQLVSTGTGIRSGSDTEVLLSLLAARDLSALPMLRGMFAFAWWDERAERLVLARDRFGIKPLVFAETQPGRWCFGSEPAALAAAGEMVLRPVPEQRDVVLTRGSVSDDSSFWQGVEVVAPAEVVTIDAHGVTRLPYWSLPDVLLAPRPATSVKAAATVLRDALADSVQAHLVSDVPVGLFLSGGLDSAAILATVRNIGAGPIQTFTITMGDQALDEAESARRAAKQFGGEHTELRVGDLDLDDTLDEFFAAMAEPSVDGLNTFIVARAARQAGVRVVMSGVGGDEALGGYPSFVRVPQLSTVLRGVSAIGRAGLGGAATMIGGRRADKVRAIAGGAPDIASVWWHYRAVSPLATRASELPAERRPATPAGTSAFAVIRYLEVREFLQRQLLRDADAFTMCRALELRTPMVDHAFLEAVAAAGEWPRGSARSYKAALFAALPELTRTGAALERKQGFVLPMSRWMRESLSARVPSRWRDLRARLEAGGHQALIDRFLAGRIHWSRVWAPYVLSRMARG
ncbi:MAG: asparagine synthase (glutamine-hydrolyzing) [Acidobacteria bacterium]|nr:asparagine synthase (glutamine-hydrolyzing) [Acidobacteriota bacterium]